MNSAIQTTRKRPVILLVEDNRGHQLLLQLAFKRAGIDQLLYIVDTGEQAIDYLFQRKKYSDQEITPRPYLLFLDLMMPGISGLDVLRIIKADPQLKIIPVIILTSSDEVIDIQQAYAAGANAYITKPVEQEKLVKIIYEVKRYWFEIVKLPQ